MKCVKSTCPKEKKVFSLEEKAAVIPIECDVGKLRSLFAYFQYRAPNIDSLHSPLLSVDKHEKVLEAIKKTHNSRNGEYVFCAHNANTESEFTQRALWGDVICGKCKRFVCKRMTNHAKRDSVRKETDLECLLRHIRNSLAHGHVFVNHGGNFISVCFEDVNDKHKLTARIVCGQADLMKWKRILEEAVESEVERKFFNGPSNP